MTTIETACGFEEKLVRLQKVVKEIALLEAERNEIDALLRRFADKHFRDEENRAKEAKEGGDHA